MHTRVLFSFARMQLRRIRSTMLALHVVLLRYTPEALVWHRAPHDGKEMKYLMNVRDGQVNPCIIRSTNNISNCKFIVISLKRNRYHKSWCFTSQFRTTYQAILSSTNAIFVNMKSSIILQFALMSLGHSYVLFFYDRADCSSMGRNVSVEHDSDGICRAPPANPPWPVLGWEYSTESGCEIVLSNDPKNCGKTSGKFQSSVPNTCLPLDLPFQILGTKCHKS